MKTYLQGNGVRVRVGINCQLREVELDLCVMNETHRSSVSETNTAIYQNLTISEAKDLIEALKSAIDDLERV